MQTLTILFKTIVALCGIVALLTAILVSAVAGQGNNTQICMTRNQVIANSALLYAEDNNDRLVPIYSNVQQPCTYVTYLAELLLPYHGDWFNYRCPDDANAEIALTQNACVGGFTRAYTRRQQISTWSLLAHRGYNYMFLAPIVNAPGSTAVSFPIAQSEIAAPANTINDFL